MTRVSQCSINLRSEQPVHHEAAESVVGSLTVRIAQVNSNGKLKFLVTSQV
jgi:hypothetical protein